MALRRRHNYLAPSEKPALAGFSFGPDAGLH
jgi:hypothetical protein